MNLNTLSSSIDPVILDRGREYVSLGCVRSIEETENGVYLAAVRGSELYEVVVELDDDDEVLSLECDCPYDFGPICKHEAAVLLELREERGLVSKRENENDSATASVSRIPVSLRAVLESASKESLVALLASLAEESDIMERRIRLSLSPISGQEAVEQCRQLIRSSIRLHSDNHGFVDWRSVNGAVEGAAIAVEKSLQAAGSGDVMTAAAINLCILEEMVDLLQSADDSSGTVSDEIEGSLERIQDLISDEAEWTAEVRHDMVRLLLNASEQPGLAEWEEWRAELLQFASYLAVADAALRDQWLAALSQASEG